MEVSEAGGIVTAEDGFRRRLIFSGRSATISEVLPLSFTTTIPLLICSMVRWPTCAACFTQYIPLPGSSMSAMDNSGRVGCMLVPTSVNLAATNVRPDFQSGLLFFERRFGFGGIEEGAKPCACFTSGRAGGLFWRPAGTEIC